MSQCSSTLDEVTQDSLGKYSLGRTVVGISQLRVEVIDRRNWFWRLNSIQKCDGSNKKLRILEELLKLTAEKKKNKLLQQGLSKRISNAKKQCMHGISEHSLNPFLSNLQSFSILVALRCDSRHWNFYCSTFKHNLVIIPNMILNQLDSDLVSSNL